LLWLYVRKRDAESVKESERMVNAVSSLKAQAKVMENFIAGMIHDIRNPLSSMICSLDFVKENEKL
jgi:signal transduction histidine kinase